MKTFFVKHIWIGVLIILVGAGELRQQFGNSKTIAGMQFGISVCALSSYILVQICMAEYRPRHRWKRAIVLLVALTTICIAALKFAASLQENSGQRIPSNAFTVVAYIWLVLAYCIVLAFAFLISSSGAIIVHVDEKQQQEQTYSHASSTEVQLQMYNNEYYNDS